jgi:type I restriction enzyme M protein
MGRVYEYFLNEFADITGGEFYTPTSVVKTIVEMIEPYSGRVYDPAFILSFKNSTIKRYINY